MRRLLALPALLLVIIILAACGRGDAETTEYDIDYSAQDLSAMQQLDVYVEETADARESPYFEPLSSLYIPSGVRVVALGEATHGSHDFKQLANDVFKRLVVDYGFRAFAIEAPLGNNMTINEYILYGVGTAREAVAQNGFWIHDFQETVDLVKWMREFNLTAEPGGELRFYGFDIQEINVSLERYLAFMRNVDMAKAIRDEAHFRLRGISFAGARNMEKEMLSSRIQDVYGAINEMKQNEEIYVKASSQLEFDFALRNLFNIKWTLEMQTLREDVDKFWNLRDERMYETIKWIVQQEEKRGHCRVFVFGHNAHIMRDTFRDLIPVGVHLAAYFGDGYFAIGTEFYQGRFRAIRMPHMFATSFVTNDYSGLINKFIGSNIDVAVLDVNRHAGKAGSMGEILNSEQLMVMIGSVFHPDGEFMIPITPAASYDAIIFVRYSTSAAAPL